MQACFFNYPVQFKIILQKQYNQVKQKMSCLFFMPDC